MFLTEDDYSFQLQDEIRDLLLGDGAQATAKRERAELAAISEMQSYLRSVSNVGQLFSQTGDDRVPVVVMYLIDMALYHLYSAISPRMIPELRQDRYDRAIAWLKMVSRGEIDAMLPPIEETDETDPTVRLQLGGRDKYSLPF